MGTMSKIFYGKKGCQMEEKALQSAKEALCLRGGNDVLTCTCNSCSLSVQAHPDLLLLDKPSYVVEDVEKILAFGKTVPVISKQKVVLVQNMGSISVESQNKLLKEIESNDNYCFMGTCYENNGYVIDTIRSRTQSITVYPLSQNEFLTQLSDPDALCLYYMTEGCLGLVSEMRPLLPLYKQLLTLLANGDEAGVLKALCLVKEKDTNSYYEKHKAYVGNLFSFVAQIVLAYLFDCLAPTSELLFVPQYCEQDMWMQVLEEATRAKANCIHSWYSKNEFFTDITKITSLISAMKNNRKGDVLK